MTRQETIRVLLDEYAARRAAAERDRDMRTEQICREYPEINALLNESRILISRGARALTMGKDSALQAAKEMRLFSEQWPKRLSAALAKAGLPEDALSLRPVCPICGDTGYIENTFPTRFCTCFENELARRRSEDGEQDQTFESFDLSVFPDTPLNGTGLSQRAIADRVRLMLRDYAETFPANRKPNIVLTGASGLGKTFLLNCVAARLRERNIPVMQLTSFRMLENMRRRHMGSYETADAFDEMLETPCLILDDLGSEPLINNITVEYLFTLLNERNAAGRATLIATNLSGSDLKTRYTERVTSRLLDISRTTVIRLEGEDLRLHR